jgi:hypothetical protein
MPEHPVTQVGPAATQRIRSMAAAHHWQKHATRFDRLDVADEL